MVSKGKKEQKIITTQQNKYFTKAIFRSFLGFPHQAVCGIFVKTFVLHVKFQIFLLFVIGFAAPEHAFVNSLNNVNEPTHTHSVDVISARALNCSSRWLSLLF